VQQMPGRDAYLDGLLGRLMTSGAALLLTAGGATAASMRAPAPADAAWAESIKSDTLEAYATFAMMYPESKHAPAAYGRLSGSPAGANAKPTETSILGDDESEAGTSGLLPMLLLIHA
jgi:hypothetical protein